MHLSGQVPARIRNFAREKGAALLDRLGADRAVHWAIHAGGRTILDAVQDGLDLDAGALGPSREVLRDFGNMSSATLMFVLARILGVRARTGPRHWHGVRPRPDRRELRLPCRLTSHGAANSRSGWTPN